MNNEQIIELVRSMHAQNEDVRMDALKQLEDMAIDCIKQLAKVRGGGYIDVSDASAKALQRITRMMVDIKKYERVWDDDYHG